MSAKILTAVALGLAWRKKSPLTVSPPPGFADNQLTGADLRRGSGEGGATVAELDRDRLTLAKLDFERDAVLSGRGQGQAALGEIRS